MPRLIDADALKEHLSGRYMNELYPDWYQLPLDVREKIGLLGSTFKQAILKAPTIDAEPVVRCKDCKFFRPYEGEEHKGDCAELVGLESCVYEDDYCSYGARKGE